MAKCRNPPNRVQTGPAETVAAELSEATAFWTETFLHSVPLAAEQLRASLCDEVLAFALCLLELRAEECLAGEAAEFCRQVRCLCYQRHRARSASSPSARRLAGTAGPADDSEFSRQFSLQSHGHHASELSEAAFEDFCVTTGLGTRTLVGRGANLAALVFYLVLHGRVAGSGVVTRERKRWLIRAARECRASLEQTLQRSLTRNPPGWMRQWLELGRPASHERGLPRLYS